MPSWLTEVLKLVGFTTPFIYAAATYSFFHWLDKRASGPAKQALTARLRSAPQEETVSNFVLEVFDRIYSSPLLSVRSILRSFAITLVVCCLVWYERRLDRSFIMSAWNFAWIVLVSIFFNMMVDYISLFFVRTWLVTSRTRPIFGSIVAFGVGVLIVYISYLIRLIFFIGGTPDSEPIKSTLDIWYYYWNIFKFGALLALMLPAMVVHLWFPLFALAIVSTQALRWLFKAVGWLQWFTKQGQHHPFQAVGLVAALIVLAVSAALQVLTR